MASEESIDSLSDVSEFDLERVLPNDERTKFLFQEHTIRYLFASQFTVSKTVLDAACGSGYGSAILSESGATKVVGIDYSSEAIEFCEKNYKNENLEFKKENCEKINLDTRFDVAVSFETIEHLKNQDDFLTEIKRTLKDDGIFIVSTPNIDTYPSGNPFHHKEFTESEFKSFLGKYFSNIIIFYQFYPSSMAISKPIDIMNDLKINFFNAENYALDDVTEKFNLSNYHGLFFIAICSNRPIENIDNKLYLYRDTIDELRSPEEHELSHLNELRELNKKKDENLKKFETRAVSHMDELRELNEKKDENLKKFETRAVAHMDELRELNEKKDEHLKHLRELNKRKDEDLEHLRNIIKEIHESSAWKLITKLDFLKKD